MGRKITIEEAMRAARVLMQLRTIPGWSESDAVNAARRLAKANRIDAKGKIRPRLPPHKCPVGGKR